MIEDLRFALRQLHRSPGFAAAVVVTLALAIGVNSAVFSLLDGFLLRRLPYPQPDRIAALITHRESKNNPANFEDDDSADLNTWKAIRDGVPAVIPAAGGQPFGNTEGGPGELAARTAHRPHRAGGDAPGGMSANPKQEEGSGKQKTI